MAVLPHRALIVFCLLADFVAEASFLKLRDAVDRQRANGDALTKELIEKQEIHTYDPEQFDMYRNCKGLAGSWRIPSDKDWHYSEPKHNVDAFFVRSMTMQMPYAKSRSVDPSKAKLFVVPVFWAQSYAGLCGDHLTNVRQLKEILLASPWYYQTKGRNHLFVCDRMDICWDTREHLPHAILGAFEKFWTPGLPYSHPYVTGHGIAIGDSTYKGISLCEDLPPVPMEERKWRISSIGQLSGHLIEGNIDPYLMRRKLWCSWVEAENKPKSFLIASYTKECDSDKENDLLSQRRLSPCEAYDVLRQSRMAFSFSGDTPTTDRIFNAFDTQTPIVMLSHEKKKRHRDTPCSLDSAVDRHFTGSRQYRV